VQLYFAHGSPYGLFAVCAHGSTCGGIIEQGCLWGGMTVQQFRKGYSEITFYGILIGSCEKILRKGCTGFNENGL